MRKRTSLIRQIRQSVGTIALLLTLPVVIGLVMQVLYNTRTQAMLRRMEAAAELKPTLESTLAENLFSVAAGRTTFEKSGAERLIRTVDSTLDGLLKETNGSGQLQLTIARRTMDTLEQYANRLRDGMENGTPIDEIEKIVDEVRDVGRLVADMLDAFISEEIEDARAGSLRLQRLMIITAIVEVLLLAVALGYSGRATARLTGSIDTAIHSLEKTVRRIAEGNFRDRLSGIEVLEMPSSELARGRGGPRCMSMPLMRLPAGNG